MSRTLRGSRSRGIAAIHQPAQSARERRADHRPVQPGCQEGELRLVTPRRGLGALELRLRGGLAAASRSRVRASDCRARSRSASARATWDLSSASSTLKSGVPLGLLGPPSRTRMSCDPALDVRSELDRLHGLQSGRWREWRRPQYRSAPRPPRTARRADPRPRLRRRRRRAGPADSALLHSGERQREGLADRSSDGCRALRSPGFGVTGHPCS